VTRPPGLNGPVHIVGVGGGAMSAIAAILREQGVAVSGSDLRPSPVLDRLAAAGVKVAVGHRAGNVGAAGVVVRSTAVPDENPELIEAARRGIPVLSRAEALAALLSGRTALGVTGTHGKTSTAAMAALVLREAGFDPGFLVGADITQLGGNAAAGSGPLFVVEADESDGTFLVLPLTSGLVTNVERDHLDHFGSLEALRRSMAEFVERIPGRAIVGSDDPFLAGLIGPVRYGSGADDDYRLERWEPDGFGAKVAVGTPLGPLEFVLHVPGRHFALNAVGAIALAAEAGAPVEAAAAALDGYRGVTRRFEWKGEAGGVMVVDDYAHNPGKVEATVAAAPSLDILYEPDPDGLVERVARLVRPGDIVVTMGAGDITDLAPLLLRRLG
jgi:UDP-N-acetylmuramate--alanine ligase